MDHTEESASRTCDICRARKVKCVPNADNADSPVCRACKKGNLDCTYEYVLQKRGRKRGQVTGSASRRQKPRQASNTTRQPEWPDLQPPDTWQHHVPSAPELSLAPQVARSQRNSQCREPIDSDITLHATLLTEPQDQGLTAGSSSRVPDLAVSLGTGYDLGQSAPPRSEQYSPFTELMGYIGPEISMATHSTASDAWDQPPMARDQASPWNILAAAQGEARENDLPLDRTPDGRTAVRPMRIANSSTPPQIEDVSSWSDISFFIGLYLQYQHSLMPLVHKPTFTNDIVMRRDRTDETFRAMLLSLTAFVICQVPMHLISPLYTQRQLEKLQHRCHVVSRGIQVRHLHTPNANVLVTIIADTYYCAATGRTHLKAALMGEVVRLVYTMRYHAVEPPEEWNAIQIQVQRRIYWHLYCHEKTDAAMGAVILMNDYEGAPPYPLETDDEFITSAGVLAQPATRPSQMVGYVTNIRLFRHLSGCLLRRRLAKYEIYGLTPGTSDGWSWGEEARRLVSQVIDTLPDFLRASAIPSDRSDRPDPFQTQRANILVTAALVEFALLDYQASCRPDLDLGPERKRLGQKTYNMLASILAMHLASNGESMRSKVLSIIVNLLSTNSGVTGGLHDDVREWWDMYCQVQFVQMIPSGADSLFPSRAPSPV